MVSILLERLVLPLFEVDNPVFYAVDMLGINLYIIIFYTGCPRLHVNCW